MSTRGSSPARLLARNIPSELNSMAIRPWRSIAMTPPSPPSAGSSSSTTSRTASRETAPAETHPRTDVVRHRGADEHLSVSGRRYGARAVVGVGSRADDRRIADALIAFAGHAARGGGGREPAAAVQGDRADGAHVRYGQRRQVARRRRGCARAAASAPPCRSSCAARTGSRESARIPRRRRRSASRSPSAPSPLRASSTGFLMWVTPQTAPALSVAPSMMEASSSLWPSRVNTAPCPALNSGSSSSSDDGTRHRVEAACRRSRARRSPPSSASASPSRYSRSISPLISARGRVPAPP